MLKGAIEVNVKRYWIAIEIALYKKNNNKKNKKNFKKIKKNTVLYNTV